MLDDTNSLGTEAAYFWKLMQHLAAAKLSGDANAIWEALDDLDVSMLYAKSSAIGARAMREVARHGFVAKHALVEV